MIEKRPHFLFLIETKMHSKKLQYLLSLLGFDGLFSVDHVGNSGGLALFWKDGGSLSIQNYSQHHITAFMKLADENCGWVFTGFYGYPDQTQREKSWRLLSTLNNSIQQAWLCIGDFNEIMDQSEKVGVLFGILVRWIISEGLFKSVIWEIWAMLVQSSRGVMSGSQGCMSKNAWIELLQILNGADFI